MSKREQLIAAIFAAADDIESGAAYQWGHVGQCNVGHIVQHLTGLSDREILAAFEQTLSEWRDHAAEYFDLAVGDEPLATTALLEERCPRAAVTLEKIYQTFHQAGLTATDIGNIEYLSDPTVLAHLPPERRHRLRRNNRHDVALYLRTYAQLLQLETNATG